MPDRSEMDQWMIGLAPELKAVFDATYDSLEATKKALPGSKDAIDAAEEKLIQQAKQIAHPQAATPNAPPPAAQDSKAPVKGSYDVQGTLDKEIPFKYGKIKLTAKGKLSVSNANAGTTAAVGGASTKLGSKGPETTVSMGASVGLKDIDLFNGIDVTGVKLTFLNTFGSSKVSISFAAEGSVNFPQVQRSAVVSGKVTLLEYSGGSLSALEASVGVAPFPFQIEVKGVKVKGECSFEASIKPDPKLLGLEVGEKIVIQLAEKELKQQAEKEGVEILGAEAAGQVLSKFVPVLNAFAVGLTIGDLLNKFTSAGLVAEKTDEFMLGDFNQQWNDAGTAKKVYLGVTNAPLIATTLVVSGAVGAVEGVGEVASKGYHAVKDYVSGPEVDMDLVNANTKQMEESLDKADMEEEERELYPQQTVAHDDPPPPPPPKPDPPKKPRH